VHDVFFADPATDSGCATDALRLVSSAAGAMARADDGTLYVLALVCGSDTGDSASHRAIIARAPGGALSWIAGTGDALESATGQVGFSDDAPGLQLDGASHLLVSDVSGPLAVRRVTIASGATTLVIGSAPADPPDYVTALASGLAAGGAATRLITGQIVIPDRELYGVREIR
jgi:hypothetical protein